MNSLNVKHQGKSSNHYQQVLMFLRRWNVNIVQYRLIITAKVKGEQVITLHMAQQLKTKNINVIPGQLIFRQCKANFLLETESLY